jgi:hypothetical protein
MLYLFFIFLFCDIIWRILRKNDDMWGLYVKNDQIKE